MQTIQIVLDEKLLKAADRAARHEKRNRSELVREALRDYLRKLEIRAMEERDRAGFEGRPSDAESAGTWEGEAVWPAE